MYTSCSLLLNSCNYLLLLETFFYINNHHIVFNFSEYNNERILLPSLPSIHLLFSLTHFTAFPSPCPYLEFTLGSNIVFSCQPFIGIFSQVFFLSCISFFFWTIQKYTAISLIWSCLIFPHDFIQVMHYWSEYHTSNVLSFSRYHIWKHMMSMCPSLVMLILITQWRCSTIYLLQL